MSSLEEFEFSLFTTDDRLASPPVHRSNSGRVAWIIPKERQSLLSFTAAPPDYLDAFLKEHDLLGKENDVCVPSVFCFKLFVDPDNIYLPPFESAELDRFLDAANALEQAVLSSKEHPTHHEYETTEHTGNDSNVIETSVSCALALGMNSVDHVSVMTRTHSLIRVPSITGSQLQQMSSYGCALHHIRINVLGMKKSSTTIFATYRHQTRIVSSSR